MSLLSRHQLEALGVSNTSDMMRLRIECIKYGTLQPQKIQGSSGPPKSDIDKSKLENLLDNEFLIRDVAKLLRVSERTIYRRMAQFDLSKHTFSELNNNELDAILGETIQEFPLCGENMLKHLLIAKGIRVQRWRLRDSIQRIDSFGAQTRKLGRLHRRVYNVMGPNHLWHIDTNHKLIRWRFVIIGGVDGFGRMTMFLKCCDNNTSQTVLNCFMSGVAKFGVPVRVRSDQGLENVSVADYMLSKWVKEVC